MTDLRRRPQGEHRGAPFRAVPGADPGHQVTELVNQRRQELLGMSIEQTRIELDRAIGEIGAAGGGAETAVEDDPQVANPPSGADSPAEKARQAGERLRPAAGRRTTSPPARRRSLERKDELDHPRPAAASAKTRSSVDESDRPV